MQPLKFSLKLHCGFRSLALCGASLPLFTPSPFTSFFAHAATIPQSVSNYGNSVVSSKPPSLRVLVYGDAGKGNNEQRVVGQAMWRHHQKTPFDFAVSTGDNQYLDTAPGVWKQIFELPFAELIGAGVPFYQTVGNHDMEKNRLADQLAYSSSVNALAQNKGGFVLPAENYVIEKPNLRWIVLNISAADGSINFPESTRKFFEVEVCKPTTGWKIVSLHYPFWSTGPRGDNVAAQAALLPLFSKCPVDFIFAGHEHQAEVFLPYNWMNFAIVGNAHEIRSGRAASSRESLYFFGSTGFSELYLENDVARFALINARNEVQYSSTVQRRPDFWADTWKQQGNLVLGRVKLPVEALGSVGSSGSQLEAQVGFSKTKGDPLLETSNYSFVSASPFGNSGSLELLAYQAEVPQEFRSEGTAVFRYRLGPQGRWIYGDLSDAPSWHGNYDGLQPTKLLRINPAFFSQP